MNASTDFISVNSADDMFPLEDQVVEIPPMSEDFDEKLQQAQEQLLKLRHQQEQIERQKSELEELGKRQESFLDGRASIAERLNRSVSVLEREAHEAERRAEEFFQTKESFARHLERVTSFNPEEWSRGNLRAELDRAIAAIEDAERDYHNQMGRIRGLIDRNSLVSTGDGSRPFVQSLQNGLGFTLPLMIFSGILFALYLVFS